MGSSGHLLDDEDFELRQQLLGLREQRDLAKARAVIAKKLTVEEDDLPMLLEKEDAGPAALAKEGAKAELAMVSEMVTQSRIAFGTLKNQTLRRQGKLKQLEEELRLLQQAAAETPTDRRQASDNRARHDATIARAEQMEQMADEQVEYTLTLKMLIKRLLEAKGGGEEMLAIVRQKMAELDLRADRQTVANNGITHAAYQARNASSLQLQLNDGGRRARQLLVHKRQSVLRKARGEVDTVSAELQAQQEEALRTSMLEEQEEQRAEGVRLMQQQQVAGRLKRLEEQFRRVQVRASGRQWRLLLSPRASSSPHAPPPLPGTPHPAPRLPLFDRTTRPSSHLCRARTFGPHRSSWGSRTLTRWWSGCSSSSRPASA
jgi:hypothetical protein